jgi:Tfp pilus assembly protein PilN
MELKKYSTNHRSNDIEAAQADVIWLPSFHFVVIRVECPNTMTGTERTSFIELAVESHSPFPVEQIYWGYYPEPSSQQALLYMGLKEQFPVSESAIGSAQYVFPSFLAAVVAKREYDGIQLFADDYGLSALWFEASNPLPRKVLSRRWSAFGVESPPSDNSELLHEIVRNWTKELQVVTDISVNDRPIRLSYLQLESSSTLHLSLDISNWQNGSEIETLSKTLTGDTLYACDVRDETQIQKLKTKALASHRLWRALQIGGAFAASLGLLAIGLLLSGRALESQDAKLQKQASAVEQVNQKEILLDSLDLFSIAALQPFEALERMNRIRPDSLYFRSLEAGANRQAEREEFTIKLKAVASSAAQADKFSAQLQADPFFSQVRLSKLRSKTKRTDFELEVQMPAASDVKTP